MRITQDFGHATYVIRAYDAGMVVVNQTDFHQSLVVMPDHLEPDWQPKDIEELTVEHLEPIVALRPELVILGTGATLRFPAPHVRGYFLQHGIGIEFMDTPAACRTYNILMSEGRSVACALIIESPTRSRS